MALRDQKAQAIPGQSDLGHGIWAFTNTLASLTISLTVTPTLVLQPSNFGSKSRPYMHLSMCAHEQYKNIYFSTVYGGKILKQTKSPSVREEKIIEHPCSGILHNH